MMKDTYTCYMCIQMPNAKNRINKPAFRHYTISGYRKYSIENLLKWTNMDWKEARKFGWVCKKVEVTTTIKEA